MRLVKSLLITSLLALAPVSFASAEQKPTIVTSIKPLKSMIELVVGNTATVEAIIGGKNSVHGYQLKPSDIKRITAADLAIIISKDLEISIADAIASSALAEKTLYAMEFEGVEHLARRGKHDHHDHYKDEDHGADHHEDEHAHKDDHHGHDKKHDDHHHDHGHSDEHAHEHDHEHRGTDDLHIWLSPKNARAIIASLAKDLSTRFPAYKDTFMTNADQATQKLEAQEKDITALLSGKNIKAIVFHDAYQYFEHDFGLPAPKVFALNPSAGTSAKHFEELHEHIKSDNITCIFAEPQFDNKTLARLAEEFKIEPKVLDPLGGTFEDTPELIYNLYDTMAKSFASCAT